MSRIQRVPRIKGLTTLVITQQSQKHIINHVLTHYLNNNYTINGEYMNAQGLAEYLKVPIHTLIRYLNTQLEVMGKLTGKVYNDSTSSAMKNQAFLGIWEAIQFSRKQLSTLASSQAGKYQPFISKEVNSAVQNYQNSYRNLLEFIKLTEPKTPTISILNQNNQATVNHAQVGPDEALKMIEAKMQESGNLGLKSEGHILMIEGQLGLESQPIPNILADAQTEEAIMAQAIKDRAMADGEDITISDERQFRDFRVVEEDELDDSHS